MCTLNYNQFLYCFVRGKGFANILVKDCKLRELAKEVENNVC